MTTAITWGINTLERETSDGYVFTIHWTVNAVSSELREDGTAYQAGAYGSTGLQRPKKLIAFDDLTKEQVLGWLMDAIGADKVSDIEAALEAQIAEQIAPSRQTGTPSSWAN